MAKVTCRLCKSKIEKETAYKISKGGKQSHQFMYYCNEQEYVAHIDSKRKKVKCRSCGTKIFADTAYNVPKGEKQDGNYCNEQEYTAYLESKRRKAKCQLCRKEIFIDTAHKVEKVSGDGEKITNHYYCTKEKYEHYASELKKYHDTMLYFATDILEYEEGQVLPADLKKQVKELNNFYPYEVIKKTLETQRNTLYSLVKTYQFKDESHMINYLMAVIKSKINDVYKAWEIERKQQQKSIKAEVDLFAFGSIDEAMNASNNQRTTPKKGISSFLEDGDF